MQLLGKRTDEPGAAAPAPRIDQVPGEKEQADEPDLTNDLPF
jgi:hypothetical protein